LKEIKTPICSFSAASDEDAKQKLEQWSRDNRREIDASLQRQREYSAKQFSKDTICGAILQIAAMGMQLEGFKHAPPHEFAHLISAKRNPNARYFCCGREVRGVPAGLIIYAARNQYNHQDSETLSELNTAIFDTIALNHGLKTMPHTKDPGFNLDNQSLKIYAGNALFVLGWNSYELYLEDMQALLKE
jgi:hypothetical protein